MSPDFAGYQVPVDRRRLMARQCGKLATSQEAQWKVMLCSS
jgi:hypothetical protein